MYQKLFILLIFLSPYSLAQKAVEHVYSPDVYSIQLFNPETNDETPFFKMGSQFILSFDLLNKGYERIYYSVKHYDRNWEDDNLFDSEYIIGYSMPQIYEYKNSFNTSQNYTHYTLEFPNKDLQLKISGNYLLTIYNNARKPIFTRKISFYENIAEIGISYERYSSSKNPNISQRVTVQALLPNDNNSILSQQISLCILQNNNWNNSQCNISPQFINRNSFTFGQLTNAFEGGNEFFSFDTKNISVPGYGTEKIIEENNVYSALLYPIISYPLDYTYNPDINGAYYFRRFDLNLERDARNEGDYCHVNFFVSLANPLEGKDLYVVGLFNNYELSDTNKMSYNEALRGYEKSIYLKQGYYNYTIATVDQKNGKISLSEIPGSFWQTENLYQGLLYYKPFGGTYDALIGYGEIRAARQ